MLAVSWEVAGITAAWITGTEICGRGLQVCCCPDLSLNLGGRCPRGVLATFYLPEPAAGPSRRCREWPSALLLQRVLSQHSSHHRHRNFTRIPAATSETTSSFPVSTSFLGRRFLTTTYKKTLYQVYLEASSLRLLNPSQSLKVLTWADLCKSIASFPLTQGARIPHTDLAKCSIMPERTWSIHLCVPSAPARHAVGAQ